MSDKLIARELKPAELPHIEAFLREAPRYHTLMLRPLLREAERPDCWWYGVADVGTSNVRAVMGIVGHSAQVYSGSNDATEVMAHTLLKNQQNLSRVEGAKRHTLFGYKPTIDKFWNIFRMVNRQVVTNAARDLMGSSGHTLDKAPSKRVDVGWATAGDLKLVAEFTAEYLVENQGFDPRHAGRTAHERHCQEAIEGRRQLVARDAGRPVLVAELRDLDAQTVLLDRIYVPPPFRTRGRLIAGALYEALSMAPLQGGRELLFFADDLLAEAALKAGYERKLVYQVVAMLG